MRFHQHTLVLNPEPFIGESDKRHYPLPSFSVVTILLRLILIELRMGGGLVRLLFPLASIKPVSTQQA
jgi:hypothetical protein